jgi:lipoyl(octanoyl) transferase
MPDAPHTPPFAVGPLAAYDLGVVPYLPTQELQSRIRRAVIAGHTPGVLLLLEHTPVITLGAHAATSDLLSPVEAHRRGVEMVRSERGGRCTLHAPGQLVTYPVMPIPRRDLRGYVNNLEEVLLVLLARYGLTAERLCGRPGLYLEGVKIASLGLRCERGVASHGTALNVDVDLSLFSLIRSCGDPLMRQTSMLRTTGLHYDMQEVKAVYIEVFRQLFGFELTPLRCIPTAGFEPATPGSGGQCSIP